MLYKFLLEFSDSFSAFNVFRYITFRSFISFFTAFLVAWWVGPHFIRRVQKLKQAIRDDGPQSHIKKTGTPTMGGGIIFVGLLFPVLLWMDIQNELVWAALIVTFGFGAVGFVDDWLKVVKRNSKGLSGKLRLALEFLISGAVIYFLIQGGHMRTELSIPFFKEANFDLGLLYVLFGSMVVVGSANAVNFTDGLDGLAIFPVMICAFTLALFAYIAGHKEISDYLGIPHVPGAGELVPLAAAVIAAGLAFLWYNAYPAQVFMGDIGSLSLGGFLGIMAVLTKNELVMLILGGVFVIEALSVITQVISFKLTGKRIFKMAPIHHHYELKGVDETKIIVRFWIISILLAVISLSTLKLR